MASTSSMAFFSSGQLTVPIDLRAFEGHVLEHVGDPGLTLRIVHRAGVHIGMEGNHGRFMALAHDEVEAVGQGEFRDLLFKLFEALGARQKRKGKDPQDASYHAYTYMTLA